MALFESKMCSWDFILVIVTEEMQSLLLRRSTFHIQHSPGLLLLSTKVKGDIEYGISSLGSGRE